MFEINLIQLHTYQTTDKQTYTLSVLYRSFKQILFDLLNEHVSAIITQPSITTFVIQTFTNNLCLLAFFKNKVFLHLGSVRPYVRPYETLKSYSLISGMLELTYRLQTFKDYSYSC